MKTVDELRAERAILQQQFDTATALGVQLALKIRIQKIDIEIATRKQVKA